MDFETERTNLIAQRDNAYMVYQQAIGAIALLDAIIASQPAKELSVEAIQNAINDGSATIEAL